jgi:hypothetical protein
MAVGLLGLTMGAPFLRAISVTDTTGWNAWYNQQGTLITDPFSDQQTGQPADDFVGTTTTAAFQQKAGFLDSDPTNQYIAFRARFGEYNPSGNGGNFSLGIDLTGEGKVNLVMRLNYKGTTGANTSIDFAKPGSGANNAPSTTSWGSFNTPGGLGTLNSNTYSYTAVTDGINIGPVKNNGNPLYSANAWITFAISYANLESAIRSYAAYYVLNGATYTETAGYFSNYSVNDYSGMSFIAFTSTQSNATNQDLLGTTGNTNSSTTFASLGAGSTFLRPGGSPVPEPAAFFQMAGLLGVGFAGFFFKRRRSVRRDAVQAAL